MCMLHDPCQRHRFKMKVFKEIDLLCRAEIGQKLIKNLRRDCALVLTKRNGILEIMASKFKDTMHFWV